jgi:hypothetical protein
MYQVVDNGRNPQPCGNLGCIFDRCGLVQMMSEVRSAEGEAVAAVRIFHLLTEGRMM